MDKMKRITEQTAITVATVFASLINKEFVSFSPHEQLVIDAMRRSSNQLKEMSLPDMGDYLRRLDTNALRGLGNNVKGIYHELRFVEHENLDGDSITARIFPETNHPGADVILSCNGGDFSVLQLKATDNVGIIKEHFERYPGIPLAATDEAVGLMPNIQPSGFSDTALENDVSHTFESISDQAPIAQLEHTIIVSGLLAAAVNASNILSGKTTVKQASYTALQDMGIAITSTYLVDLLFS